MMMSNISCWWGTFMLWWGIYISKSISGLGREEEIPCVSWWHVSAEAKERFLAQQVSEVEKIQLYLLQKIEAWGKSEVEDRRLMKREAQRKEAKERFLAQGGIWKHSSYIYGRKYNIYEFYLWQKIEVWILFDAEDMKREAYKKESSEWGKISVQW